MKSWNLQAIWNILASTLLISYLSGHLTRQKVLIRQPFKEGSALPKLAQRIQSLRQKLSTEIPILSFYRPKPSFMQPLCAVLQPSSLAIWGSVLSGGSPPVIVMSIVEEGNQMAGSGGGCVAKSLSNSISTLLGLTESLCQRDAFSCHTMSLKRRKKINVVSCSKKADN